jgi:hypothetical protein
VTADPAGGDGVSAGTDQEDGVRAELLLHSLAALREIVLPALELAGARRIVEVGGELGGFTAHLVRRAAAAGGHVDVVDPAPSEALDAFARSTPGVSLVRRPSPAALRELPLADAYVLDGDHNYVTVSGELSAIGELAHDAEFPLVILHDVGWPCARRDQYYRPDALPSDAIHPYSYEGGVVPESSGIVDGGFSGAGEFAYAIEEGGPRNGVLTAVDDFRAERATLAFVRVPSVFGLGLLFDSQASYAPELSRSLAWCDESPFLERLERNRMALYLRLHDVGRERDTAVAERDRARQALADLRATIGALADSRSVRVADAVLVPARIGRAWGGLGRVLRDLAGEVPPEGDRDPAG